MAGLCTAARRLSRSVGATPPLTALMPAMSTPAVWLALRSALLESNGLSTDGSFGCCSSGSTGKKRCASTMSWSVSRHMAMLLSTLPRSAHSVR